MALAFGFSTALLTLAKILRQQTRSKHNQARSQSKQKVQYVVEQPIQDTQCTRDLYSSPDVLPVSATVDASLGLDSQLIAKARIAFDSYGVCLVKHFFNTVDTKTALQTLKDIIVAPDPRVSSIYFEGSLREHLRTASSFEGKTSLEMVGDDVTNNDQRKLIMALDEVERLRYVRKVMGFSHSSYPCLQELSKRVGHLAGLLHGENPVVLMQDMAMVKPPGGREKPWHQDHAYFNYRLEDRIIGTWIALTEANAENGCMQVLLQNRNTESKFERLATTHFKVRDWQICDSDIRANGDSRASVPMEPGDVLLFDSTLPHGTKKNTTSSHRWGIQLHYAPTDSEKVSNEDRLAIFGAEGKNVTC